MLFIAPFYQKQFDLSVNAFAEHNVELHNIARNVLQRAAVCIRFITIPEMHHNNMSTGSRLWHFLYGLVRVTRSVVSSEKEAATTSRNRNWRTCYYDAFRERSVYSPDGRVKQFKNRLFPRRPMRERFT